MKNSRQNFSFYSESIIAACGCSADEVAQVEEVMREDVVHSTLDWLSLEEFNKAAILAYRVYNLLNDSIN